MTRKIRKPLVCILIVCINLSLFAGGNTEAPVSSPAIKAENPKYVFMFIGDGMSHVQVNAAQVYLGNNTSGQVATKSLNFTRFPAAGVATTHDATSFCPDSASTATSFASGIKTHSGVIGLGVDKSTKAPLITELLQPTGKKIGIVSSVTINHATPAAYYAHVPSRNNYYDIAMQLANSGFDYFGGGSISQPRGAKNDQPDAYEVIAKNGYKVTNDKAEILALNNKSGKVYAYSPLLQDSGAMPYAIDLQNNDLTLADFLSKGIDVLDNENGFFLMCESGKIDWACHANDAMATIQDTLAFEKTIQVALDFAQKNPKDTLIIVTGDHETGGMTIGYATTGYNTTFALLNKQKMSYVAFDDMFTKIKAANPSLKFEEALPIIKQNFGLMTTSDADAAKPENKALVLTDLELGKLREGFAESMKMPAQRAKTEQSDLLYGGYDPLSVSITHILNNKAGIGWTSYSHTGTPVPVFAYGKGAQVFNGSYDNTDVFKKLAALYGLAK